MPYRAYIPGQVQYPPGVPWYEGHGQPQDREFHRRLMRDYGEYYRRDPDVIFHYTGGWDGPGAQRRYRDWQRQFLDLQEYGATMEPDHGGFVHGGGWDLW
ncbi:unnamed protein product [Zymoseptoria tritici ST99CH_3D1]|nr:unnamed protein product [Zymoseptoria tritici ST99CH_3D1]